MIIFVVFLICAALSAIIAHYLNWAFGAAFLWAAFGSFVLQGLRRIPAVPPHVGLVTIWGKRTRMIKKEGWRFFPLFNYWYGVILINMEKKNHDFPPQTVRTRDLAEIELSVSITWTPNEDYVIEYLNNGQEEGVTNILTDLLRERLREWAISLEKSPATWEEALRASEQATLSLLTNLFALRTSHTATLSQEDIWSVRIGDGHLLVPSLGITLNRLNIKEIKPLGALASAAELMVKEQREREGEKVEIYHALDRIQEIQDRLNCSTAQAIELFQTERSKVTKKIHEIKGSVSDETLKAVLQIIDTLKR